MSRRGSGDPIADRRFVIAESYAAAGDLAAAIDLLDQTLALAPGWVAGHLRLGEWREAAGDRAGAIAAWERALALDPLDESGAGARLARCGARPADGAISPAHVAALFDDYAPRFEASLVGALSYDAPARLRAAIDAAGKRRFGHALDLGCGTGLAGLAFADCCDRIDGVDLSAGMLKQAAARGLYARLDQADLMAALAARLPASLDLVLAADVFVYCGDLTPVIAAAARALAADGLMAFTVQRHDGPEAFVLGPDLRTAHAAAHVEAAARAAGLATVTLAPVSTRLDAGRPVPGLLAVLRKRRE